MLTTTPDTMIETPDTRVITRIFRRDRESFTLRHFVDRFGRHCITTIYQGFGRVSNETVPHEDIAEARKCWQKFNRLCLETGYRVTEDGRN